MDIKINEYVVLVFYLMLKEQEFWEKILLGGFVVF
jgi:hypothetical protein